MQGSDYKFYPTVGENGAWISDSKQKAIPVTSLNKPSAPGTAYIPEYDQFVGEFMQTAKGKELIASIEKERQQTLLPSALREILAKELRGVYEEAKNQATEAGGNDYEKARLIISKSAEKDWYKLRSLLLEKTKLTSTQIDTVLQANGAAKPKTDVAGSAGMSDEEFLKLLRERE